MIRFSNVVTWPIISILLLWSWLAWRSSETYEKRSFLRLLVILVHFHKILGKSRNKSYSISLVVCLIALVFFQDQNWQQGMLKLNKIVNFKCF